MAIVMNPQNRMNQSDIYRRDKPHHVNFSEVLKANAVEAKRHDSKGPFLIQNLT